MSEALVHEMVCQYVRYKYPDAIFHTDFAAGTKLTMGQAVRNKKLQSERAWPDLTIAEPRGSYHGMYLEIKDDGVRIYLKDGITLVASKHIREQDAMLGRLMERGYYAQFGLGFDHCIAEIDEYMGLP
jgi:hypothetical protein